MSGGPISSGRCVCGKRVGDHGLRHKYEGGVQVAEPGLFCRPTGDERYCEAALHPIGGDGRIIVRRDPDQEATAAGVVIPIVCRRHDVLGTVLAVHSGVVRPCLVRVGDRVLFGKYAGSDVRWKGEVVTIMPEDEVMAVIEPAPLCMFCGGAGVHECTGGTYRPYRKLAGEYVPAAEFRQVFPGKVDAAAFADGEPTKRRLHAGVFEVHRKPKTRGRRP